MVRHFAGSFDVLDLLGRQSPQSQFLTYGGHSSTGHLQHNTQTGILNIFHSLQGLEQLLLSTEQLGAVKINHMVAFIDRNPCIVYIKSVQPARDPCSNVFHRGFIVIYLAHHKDSSCNEFTLYRGCYDVHQFPGIFADHQLTYADGSLRHLH